MEIKSLRLLAEVCRVQAGADSFRGGKKGKADIALERRSAGMTLHQNEQISLFLDPYYSPAFNMQRSRSEKGYHQE